MNQLDPVERAAKDDRLEDVQRLVAYVSVQAVKEELLGKALDMAAYWGHAELVRWLLENGADPNKAAGGGTPLMGAASNAQVDIVRLLLDAGADPNGKDDFDSTALMQTAVSECLSEEKSALYLDIAKLLCQSGSEVNAVDSDGCTALIRSVFKQRIEFIKLLLRFGADPDIGPEDAGTAFEIAERRGQQDIVALFKNRDVRSSAYSSAEHKDSSYQQNKETKIVKDLDLGLTGAASEGNVEKVRQLLAAGADKNAQDPFVGLTPLHYAASCGHKSVVEVLLAAGADKNLKTKSGETPLDVAKKKGHTALIDVLTGGYQGA